MNIICKNEKIQNRAIDLVKQLKIDDKDVIVSIRKLPKNISLQNTKGYIEFDEQLELGHFTLSERKCSVCGKMKDLIDGYYLIRKNKNIREH